MHVSRLVNTIHFYNFGRYKTVSMHKKNWNFMNAMPAIFRKKTTKELMETAAPLKEIIIKEAVKRTEAEAKEYATLSSQYHKILAFSREFAHFSTIDGDGYRDQKKTRAYFTELCKTMSAENAAKILTVWEGNTWKRIFDLPEESL